MSAATLVITWVICGGVTTVAAWHIYEIECERQMAEKRFRRGLSMWTWPLVFVVWPLAVVGVIVYLLRNKNI